MNILTVALLYVVSQPVPGCGAVPFQSAIFVAPGQVHAAAPLAQAHPVAGKRAGPVLAAVDARAETSVAGDADLLFYLESHAQALSDSNAGSLDPWVELHPVGAVQDVPSVTVPVPDAAGQRAGHQGNRHTPGGGRGCS